MRHGLTIVVPARDQDRLLGVLRIAAAEAALGGRVRLFFDSDAVLLLVAPDGEAASLLATTVELGGRLIVCQSGLATHDLHIDRLAAPAEPGGLVGLLADLGGDRLLMA